MQQRRADATTPERHERQDSNRRSTEAARAEENTPLRDARREADRNATRGARAEEITPAREARRDLDRLSTQRSRDAQDTPTRNARQRSDGQARTASRQLFAPLPESSPSYRDLGMVHIECSHCKALHFVQERIVSSSAARPMFSTCCGKGKLSLPLLTDPPALLRSLLIDDTPRACRFRKNIRAYNSALSMASVVAKWVNRGPGTSNFNPTMTMQGEMYHYMGPMMPSEGRAPSFASVYIHDTDYGTQTRTRLGGASTRLEDTLLMQLTHMLHECNPYVQTVLSMREWAQSPQPNTPAPYQMVIHADRRPSHEHVRRYNVLDPISVSHRAYDPLSYVLLFPNGRDGWYPELRFSSDDDGRYTKITPMMYYGWHLFERAGEFSTILHAARLFQQYLVDQFCKVEAERLSYLRHNQTQLRAADYTSLRDSLGDSGRAEDEADAVRAGRLFILPSTYIGGDRYMRQQMHDIIAISNQIGHPDIFLTMTCNPSWPEITRPLLPNQTPQDRPDLCARVFRLKMKDLMSLVINEGVFGTVVAHVRVIEFQKRGLPHAHVVFFLDEVSKNDLRTPENVDRIISAEIPSAQDPELQEVVLKHMIHNPCGERNPTAVCMGEQYCRKGFPKSFKHETSQSPSAGGVSIERPSRVGRRQQSVVVDNSWVVPHSPLLLRSFACHLNVELCVSRVGGIKYLFKYVCKGQDRVTMEITAENECHDEISNFQDARYVSASEAAWRLFSFDIVDRNPPAVRLTVHLPNHHTVYFEEGREQEAALRPASGTKLTEWFKANEKYPSARHLRYHKFPRYFTWKTRTKSWTYDFSGTGANVVGRIYTVSPREGERYFLRLILTQVPGATSFENLRNIDGEQCTSFRQACLRLGLLADDAEWKHAIRDSFRSSFVPLSHLFATILAHCQPSDPLSLWNDHLDMFLTDIRNRARRQPIRRQQLRDDHHATSYVLREVQEALQTHERSSGKGDYRRHFLRTRRKQVIAVATSAVAAVLLDGGRTAHSVFKIPIPVSAESTCSFSANSDTGRTLQQVDLIIWDEIVMCHRHCIETVDRSLRDLMQTDRPFGGKFLVLAGDFRQILPVVPGGSRGQIVSACVKASPLYRECRFLRLTENMRLAALRADPAADVEALNFPEFLLSVGEGRLQGEQRPEWISLPQSVAFEHTIRNLCLKVFQGIRDNHADPAWLTKRVILTTKNRPLEEVNEVIGNMIPGSYRTYLSADKVENEDTNALIYPTEMLNTLTAGSALPDHKLKLKKGFIVMLLRNLDPATGHVNGARYVIENMTNNLLFLHVTTGSHQGNRLCLPRMPCGPGDDNFPIPGFTRTQFPIRTCFALTTNKAQGQSFGGRIGLDLRDHCFSHGQLYVALSRTTHPGNVTVLTRESNETTRNVVYPEVLQ
ncbi:ATP dependant DNA helicase [Chondrus crispus]|uniref:ATP-dependent DNA helicase n=1 Tax=Chondrus crispus TaxID=2769 RepID=R7QMI1_CHOCR|nr:ATP dependant DNA helicase [Chondrus crispus]CDF38585.1 ATP dependant DNA helicase [Chondrus crispus]|eukprot:XP_005718490.1 ATP dependant DNA helicase [Chondrus crispus]